MCSNDDLLINGYKDFYDLYFTKHSIYAEFQDKQKPHSLVIACSDSRVDPLALFSCKPGDLFVIRNVANIVPPYRESSNSHHGVKSAIEFGINILNIPQIVIIGHSRCAGIHTLLHGGHHDTKLVTKWVNVIKDAKQQTLRDFENDGDIDQWALCSKYGLLISAKNLANFPWIQTRLQNNSIKIRCMFFDIISGQLEEYDFTTKQFVRVVSSLAK